MDQREEDLIDHTQESAGQAGSVAERADREDGVSAGDLGGATDPATEQHGETVQDQLNEAFESPPDGQPEDEASQLGGQTASQAADEGSGGEGQ